MLKKLLFLGGSYFQVPAIRRAKELGYYVITADYLPSNPGHRYSDEYHNISTTDREGILNLAKELKVNGVIAYASDPAAPVAAFVATELNLPTPPLESVLILGIKDKWNKFLKDNNFNVPKFISGGNFEDFRFDQMTFPLIIKPVDSSGSKGVTLIQKEEDFPVAFEYAQRFSGSKRIIAEEFVEMTGFMIGGDGFYGKDKVEFVSYGDVYANENNPLVPSGFSIPTRLSAEIQSAITKEIERALGLLKVRNLSFNLEVMQDAEGKIYLKEMGPRNGGYFVPQLTAYESGVSLVDLALRSAMEPDFKAEIHEKNREKNDSFYGFFVIHSDKKGIFEGVTYSFDEKIKILEEHIFVSKGDTVYPFSGSNHAMGVVICEFENLDILNDFYSQIEKYFEVNLSS